MENAQTRAQRNNIMILKGRDREWIRDACENGLLSAEADRRCMRIMKENERLRRENAYLNGIIGAQQNAIRSFRQADYEAKCYMFERREGYRMGRGFRWIVGSSMVALGVMVILAIYSMIVVW